MAWFTDRREQVIKVCFWPIASVGAATYPEIRRNPEVAVSGQTDAIGAQQSCTRMARGPVRPLQSISCEKTSLKPSGP